MMHSLGSIEENGHEDQHTRLHAPLWSNLDIANLGHEVVELLLGLGILLGHLLILGLPRVALGLEGLSPALVVSRLDVGLTKAASCPLVTLMQ